MRRRYRVTDPTGLHARPAADFVQAMAALPGGVRMEYGERSANAKSILQVLGLGVRADTPVIVDFAEARPEDVAAMEARLASILEAAD